MFDINKKYGRLTPIKLLPHCKCICLCDCGNTITARTYHLASGHTQSCGCLQRERSSSACRKSHLKHGCSHDPLYRRWLGIRERCRNKKGYEDVNLCSEWEDYEKFEKWSLENGYKKSLSIDRIDPFGDYEPNNCRWTDAKQQANNRRKTIYVAHKGITHTISEWSDITKLPQHVIRHRLRKGWDIGMALTQPVMNKKEASEFWRRNQYFGAER